MAGLLLGVDVGTSGVKVGLFSVDGRLLGLTNVPCRPDMPRPGWAETPPERWWRAFTRALGQLAAKRRSGLSDVEGVGFSVLFPALIPMDARGRPLRNAILYCDQRSTAQVDRLARAGTLKRIEKQTANRVVPGTCSATSMLWLRDNEPTVYRRTEHFGHTNSYIVARLTGRIAMDKTNASLTGLTVMGREDRFSPALARRFGVAVEKLPEIVAPTDVVGEVTGRAARSTGLRAGTPVVMGAGDAVTAALGAGLARHDEIFCAGGSSDCAVVATPTPPTDSRFANCAYCTPGLWASIGTMTSSGAAIDWFARCAFGREGAAAEAGRLAARAAPGSRGLLFLPYLQGERTPIWDPKARGAFVGLSLATGLAEKARAVFEGTALGLRQVIETLEASYGIQRGRIFAVGGCTRNRMWMQIKASALGRPIRVLDFQETSALGAAMMAGLGTGLYKSPRTAMRATAALRRGKSIAPVPRWRKIYEEYYPIYRGLYPRLSKTFHELAIAVERTSANQRSRNS